MTQTASPHYTVKSITTIAATSELQARLYALAPDDVIPWHFHRHVTDWYFCLGGSLHVETCSPHADKLILVGGYYSIPPYTAHRISNGGDDDCRFVLLQGVGHYDFNEFPAAADDVGVLGGRG